MLPRLSLLGAPQIERGGRSVVLTDPVAAGLLAYLAMTGGPSARAAITALLWPGVDGEQAITGLDHALTAIRHVAGDVVHDCDGRVALDPDVAVDVHRTRALLDGLARHDHAATVVCRHCAGPLREIAALHRGPFLEGVACTGKPAYEHWKAAMADRQRRELAGVLSRIVDVHVRTADLGDAVRVAARWLSLDPLDESAHRTLMRLYGWLGRGTEALRQYRACTRALQAELGVSPLPETTRLYEDVLAGRAAVPPTGFATADAGMRPPGEIRSGPIPDVPPGGTGVVTQASRDATDLTLEAPPVPGASHAPLVGREYQLGMLADTIARVHRDGVVIIVEGEAGIGRTRLLAELEVRTTALGRRVLATACRQDETLVPYGAVIGLLRSALGRSPVRRAWLAALRPDVVREVGRLLPELVDAAGAAPPAAGTGGAWRLMDAAATALVAAASAPSDERPPGVVVIDDIQWIDRSSLDVVVHLARRLMGGPVSVVLAWRTDLVGRGHRLRRLVADLARRQLVRQLPLNRLDLTEVRALHAAAVGPDRLEAPSAEQILDVTEGVPRLVMDYLAAVVGDPVMLRGSVPASAHDLLLGRLSGLGPCARQVLEAAAVISRPFDADLLCRVSGRTPDETADALASLSAAGLLTRRPDGGGYELADAPVRAMAVERAGVVRLAALHRRVALAFERCRRLERCEPAIAGTIAAHHAAAGDHVAAAPWYERAADHAARSLAVHEAVAYYERALALGHTEPQRCHEALGDLQLLAGRHDQALSRYEAAAALTPHERGAALEHKIARVHLSLDRCDLAEQHLAIASALQGGAITDGAALGARILIDRGLVARYRGEDDQARSAAHAALRAAETTDDLGALAGAHNLMGVLSRRDLAAARGHLDRALTLARRLRDADIEIAAADNLAHVHAAIGALDRAVPLVESALARAAQIGDRRREAVLCNHLADLLRDAGRKAEAMAHLKRAVALFAGIGEPEDQVPEPWRLAAW